MEVLSNLGILSGTAWASGINLYLTCAGLGIAQRMNILSLPGNLDFLSHPLVIAAAVIMYAVEFFADKIPFVDSAWDSVHTFIRPLGGAFLAYMATTNAGPVVQFPAAVISGAVSLDSHLTKATARAAINTSPEPITNSIASVTEDGLVVGVLWMIINHPVIAVLCVIGFIVFSVWFLKVMYRFLRRVFRFFGGSREETSIRPEQENSK